MGIKIEKGKFSVESDWFHILNLISGETDNLNASPFTSHINFNEMNVVLKGIFASTVSILQEARTEDDIWMKFLGALSKGTKELKEMDLDFNEEG